MRSGAPTCYGTKVDEILEEGVAFILSTVVEDLRQDDGSVSRWWAGEAEEEGLVSVVLSLEFVHKIHNLWKLVWKEDERSSEDLIGLLIAAEREGCHDAEVLFSPLARHF